MNNILFFINLIFVFIFAYLSGMVVMADRKVNIIDLTKTWNFYKGNGKLFAVFYILALFSMILVCCRVWVL